MPRLGAVRRARAAAPSVPLVVLTASTINAIAAQRCRKARMTPIKGQIESRGLNRALRYAVERIDGRGLVRRERTRPVHAECASARPSRVRTPQVILLSSTASLKI